MFWAKEVDSPSPFRVWQAGLVVLCLLTTAAPTHGAVPLELNDRAISDAVEQEIGSDFLVPLNRIDVLTVDGIVTLRGIVSNLATKERAGYIAESVRGVMSVVNEITVRADLARTPTQTKTAVEEALVENSATEAYEVVVEVGQDGKVTLSGTVGSWAEKELAGKVAKTAIGVTSVDNAMTVAAGRDRPHAEIKAEIEERLRWNVLVDDGLIKVRVDGGTAYLEGIVGSAAEKRLARQTAWVTGVQSVDVTGLMVERWARDADLRNPRNVHVPSDEIEKAVAKALFYDPRIVANSVTVEAGGGVVVLRGAVNSLQAKRAAEQNARHTVGVRSVTNNLKVRPEMLSSDAVIAKAVVDALARDVIAEDWEIEASAKDGVVTLTGSAENFYEKMHAENVAAAVKGVEDIKNFLTVVDRGTPYTYDPYYDQRPAYRSDWYDYHPRFRWIADAEIEQSIESQLWWSPFVDSDEVTVAVVGGVATLTGTVDTWPERSAAHENALEGGAAWVVNELQVKDADS